MLLRSANALLFLLYYASHTLCASADEWRTRSIYQVFTDRFALPDNSTSKHCDPSEGKYCGGTWQGVINQLDYIQGMGFTAVWISPVTNQLQGSTPDGEAYHGYWQQDLYRLNSNFGTENDLRDLSDSLHARGMYLMLDIVVNHVAWNGGDRLGAYKDFDPFDSSRYFHAPCLINQVPEANTTTDQQCWLGSDMVALPDLRTEDDDVRSLFGSWIEGLVANYSVDGLRIDSALNIEPSFFPGFLQSANVFATGEVFTSNVSQACEYQEDSIGSFLNYPVFFQLIDSFNSSAGGFSNLVDTIETLNSSCSDPTMLATFQSNHDQNRFASYTDDTSLAANILTYVLLQPGIPVVYYGDEQQLPGTTYGNANRQALWLEGYDKDAPLYIHLTKLNKLRNHAISTSDYAGAQSYVAHQDSNTIAFIRNAGDTSATTVTLLTNNGVGSTSYTIQVPTPYEQATSLTDIVSCNSVMTDESGMLGAQIQDGAFPVVYFPSDSLDGSGLCGRSESLMSQTPGGSSETFPPISSSSPGLTVSWSVLLATVGLNVL